MKIKGIDFAFYCVSDLKKSIDFYQNTLGLKLTGQGDTWAEFMVGNLALDLGTWGKATVCTSGVAFAVEDVKASLAELKKKGVKVDDPFETEVCDMATFNDPDGNTICLHKRKDGTVG